MKVSELHSLLIEELKKKLKDWKFVASKRHFKKANDKVAWYIHLAFINHEADFDVVVNVAVEFFEERKGICILGAELGNIANIGQKRFSIDSPNEIQHQSDSLMSALNEIGLPFLEKYSDPAFVLKTLKNGGPEALLISPFTNGHDEQIENLTKLLAKNS